MICANCHKEILWQEGQKYINLNLKVLTGHRELMPVILGDDSYCIECFSEIAGNFYIPKQYVIYK